MRTLAEDLKLARAGEGVKAIVTIRLRPAAEVDRRLREHLESTHFFEETGEPHEPTVVPEVPGWGEDGDE